MSNASILRQYMYIGSVVAAYWVVSIATVFVNKILLNSVDLDAPFFITWFQCVISYAVCLILSVTRGFSGMLYFPKGSPWNWRTMKAVIPLSIIFTAMIALNNLCLKHVSVAFYYISRSLVSVFNVIFMWYILGERTDLRCIICCVLMLLGYVLAVDEESLFDSFSLMGTVYGVVASMLVALYSIRTKRVLPLVQNQVCVLSYCNSAYSMVIFVVLIVANGEIYAVYNYPKLNSPFFWIQMIGGGLCGFAIGIVTSLQIKVTSPLTHTVSGTAKSCAQTILAIYWWSEVKTGLWWLANLSVLAASAAYARFRQLILEAKRRNNPLRQTETFRA